MSTVDQTNVAELPGSVAGFLSGRVWTASLGWGDWLRLRTARWFDTTQVGAPITTAFKASEDEKALRLEQLPDDSDHEFEIVAETRFQDVDEVGQRSNYGSMSRSDAAFRLIASVRKQVRRQLGTEHGSKHRARAAGLLSREIHNGAASVSSTIQLLCLWAVDLLLRPGRSRKLATSSVIRYFGALSPRFQSVAYDVDLAAMEDVEIEAIYSSVLSGAKVENLKDTYDGLWNFHKFAQTACGLVDIDWSVLAVSERIRLGSPGFIDESSYVELLKRLGEDHGLQDVASWQLQCVALFAFRFGLRGGEATGLRRSDLHLDGPQSYLIVRNNRVRDLKTRASRRVVPLMFDLTPIEASIVAKLRDFHAVDGIGLEDAPAFSRVNDPAQAVDSYKMRAAINRHLKEVTGQASSSMHKLRKGFAIRIWRAIEAPDYCECGLAAETDAARQRIRLTLLGPGHDRVSRRGAWAVTLSLGHAWPQSSLRSYVHILSDVAEKSVAIAHLPASLGLTADLVKIPSLETMFDEVSPSELSSQTLAPPAAPIDALRALLFLSMGRSTSEAAEFSGVPISRVEQLSAITERIYKKLLEADGGHLQKHVENPSSRRLARRGILSLLHINAHSRLRTGLATLSTNLIQRLSSIESIEAPEWEAMVGGRREISMWLPDHFELTAVVARHFLEAGSRPKLLAPRAMTSIDSVKRLTEMAIETGWLPRTAALPAEDDGAPLCLRIETAIGLPRVRRADKGFTINDRLVLRLTGIDAKDRICDGLELAVALACANTFSSIESA